MSPEETPMNESGNGNGTQWQGGVVYPDSVSPLSRYAAGLFDFALASTIETYWFFSLIYPEKINVWIIFATMGFYYFASMVAFGRTVGDGLSGIVVLRTNSKPLDTVSAAKRCALSFGPGVPLALATQSVAGFWNWGQNALGITVIAIVWAYWTVNMMSILLPSRVNFYDYLTDSRYTWAPALRGKPSVAAKRAALLIAASAAVIGVEMFFMMIASIKWG